MAPLAVKVAELPEQIDADVSVNVGGVLIVTVDVPVPVQLPLVPLTVYDVVTLGVTITEDVLAPKDTQVYVVAPEAVSVALWPAQTVGELTVIEMLEPTATLAVVCAVQVPLAPITVYVALEPGDVV